jgi:hypothetical protein
MRKMTIIALMLAGLVAGGSTADAGEAGRKAGGTVEEGAKTGGRAVRDGARTFARTTKAFFTRGPKAARETWNANAKDTAENARAGGRATRDAARDGGADAAE